MVWVELGRASLGTAIEQRLDILPFFSGISQLLVSMAGLGV